MDGPNSNSTARYLGVVAGGFVNPVPGAPTSKIETYGWNTLVPNRIPADSGASGPPMY
jgi:hypothetical protein